MFRAWAWLAKADHWGHAFKWLLSTSFSAWHWHGWAVLSPTCCRTHHDVCPHRVSPITTEGTLWSHEQGKPFLYYVVSAGHLVTAMRKQGCTHKRCALLNSYQGEHSTERSSSTQPWMPSPCPCFPGILSLPTVLSVKAQLKSLRMTGKQSIDLMLQYWLSDREKMFWILNSCNWKLLYSSVQKHKADKSLGRDF